jgi:hypothetical protein
MVTENENIDKPTRVIEENRKIEGIEGAMLHLPQIECLLNHHFCEGVYLRELTMPAGSKIIGHEHKTKHFNIVLSGKADVSINGDIHRIEAPYLFISEPGVRKVLNIVEDMTWVTVHPTEHGEFSSDLESDLIIKSEEFQRMEIRK